MPTITFKVNKKEEDTRSAQREKEYGKRLGQAGTIGGAISRKAAERAQARGRKIAGSRVGREIGTRAQARGRQIATGAQAFSERTSQAAQSGTRRKRWAGKAVLGIGKGSKSSAKFIAGVAKNAWGGYPESGLMRSYYFSKAKTPIKEKFIPMSLAMIATIVTLSLGIPYLWYAFLALFIYFMVPEKHKIYGAARRRAEGNFEIDLPDELYERALAAGMNLQSLTKGIENLTKQGKTEQDIIRIITRSIVKLENDESDEEVEWDDEYLNIDDF